MCGGPEKSVVHGVKVDAITDKKNTAVQKKINVSILEMEDVLFHHNSAVMMPESPIEEPKDDKGSEKQEKVTGVKAMALIFKQYEFDPDKKLLIAGHTDTSGDDKYNFELSELRAKNVLYILTAERDKWAEISYSKQKVEDYQQVMNYVNKIYKYPCNSGKIDNKWGDITRQATETFINYYNGEFRTKYGKDFTGPMALTPIHPGQLELVKKDGDKRWTVDLWVAAYNYYFLAFAKALDLKPSALYDRVRTVTKWVDDKNKYVSCGESFPIDQAKKDNYRSQDNRRVEILIFDDDESPAIKCPVTDKGKPKWDTKHKPDECPLWHNLILKPLYLDPKDLNSITYHMAFTYYNQVKNKVMNVPEGLAIEAFQDGNKVESIIGYNQSKKIYKVKVRYKKPIKDLAGIKLHFEFKTKGNWIYTKNKDSEPVIFPGKDENKDLESLRKIDAYKDINKVEDIAKLQLPGSLNFYDLPKEWSSVNYWTRYKGSDGKDTGERFQKAIADADKMHLKPMGSKLTKSDKPMTFSLDDIVLIDEKGQQNINDTGNAAPKDKTNTDTATNLSDKSRFSLFYVKNEDLILYNPEDADTPYFTKCKFKENLITDVPKDGPTRLIVFANDFYSVSNKRAVKDAKFKANKHVLGCRAACIDDPDKHAAQEVRDHEYEDGTLTLALNSNLVTGVGTAFVNNIMPGDKILTYGLNAYTVKSIEDNTHLTLTGIATSNEAGVKYIAKSSGAEFIEYNTGTITLTFNSDVVTGVGTKFFGNIFPDAFIRTAGGNTYTVECINSDTELVLNQNAAANEANVNYRAKSCHFLYRATDTGNFELHYIHDGCMISDTSKLQGLKKLSFLLIYWNGSFKAHTYPLNSPNKNIEEDKSVGAPPNTALTITPAHVRNYETLGLQNAKKRWEDKQYTIEPVKSPDDGGNCITQIKPVFFFEAKQNNLGGKPKCNITVTNDIDDGGMSPTSCSMYHKDYQINDYLNIGTFIDIDNKRYRILVIAHELGHAKGKDDDYAYATSTYDGAVSGYVQDQNPSDKEFAQYYYGMPYSGDVGSMMKDNRAPRMKHIWFFINWINEACKNAGSLRPLLGDSKFKIVHRFTQTGAPKQLNYYLDNDPASVPPKDYRFFCKPHKVGTPIGAGTGNVGLGLYKLGEDEAALKRIKANGVRNWITFDGTVSVFIKLEFTWTDGVGGSWSDKINPADPKSKRKWSFWESQLHQAYNNLNSRPFYLENTVDADHDFKKILIFIFPTYRVNPVTGSNYDIDITLNNSAAATTKIGRTLNIGSNFPHRHIVNYTLGKDDNTAIIPADLNFIRDWIRTVLNNNNFNIKRCEI